MSPKPPPGVGPPGIITGSPLAPEHAKQAGSAAAAAFAFDCEMVSAVFSPGAASERYVVSVGVVDERLEKILEARIKVPAGCTVVDDSFARAEGGLVRSEPVDRYIHSGACSSKFTSTLPLLVMGLLC